MPAMTVKSSVIIDGPKIAGFPINFGGVCADNLCSDVGMTVKKGAGVR